MVSVQSVASKTAVSVLAPGCQVSAAPDQRERQLSRGVSASVTVQAEWSGLTMGVSLTELGAFKHDDSYFRASRGGEAPHSSLPTDGGISGQA